MLFRSAIKAIEAMNRPTLLIGGGYDKQADYHPWIEAFDGKVRYLVLIGQTREKIQKAAEECGFTDTILADNLEEAVKICAEKAQPGDAVPLSHHVQAGDSFIIMNSAAINSRSLYITCKKVAVMSEVF